MKKRILFVDDEPRILSGLRHMLYSMRGEWDMAFVESAEQALEALSRESFDMIVTDVRMPGMNGVELLNEVMKRYPNTIRFILSGHSDQQIILNSVASAHQYLHKPCHPEKLKTAIARACSLRDRLADASLERLAVQLKTLPSLPPVYLELRKELQSPDASMRRIGEIISKDIGMTAKIMQLVNSAFFGLPHRVSSPAQAAGLLGLDIIRALVLSVHVFSELRQARTRGFSGSSLWHHSLAVGAFAMKITQLEKGDQNMVGDAFTAGLLHDSGKLLLAVNMPEKYSEAIDIARENGIRLNEAEHRVLGATHAELGAHLLGLWAFSDPIVEALAFHHQPLRCPDNNFSPLAAVHVADALDYELNRDSDCGAPIQIDIAYLERLGLDERLSVWREACRALTEGEEAEHECEGSLRR